MRILFLTNFYPPHELGGQGLSCQQVVEGLKQRGHTTAVLTSMHGTDNVPDVRNDVHRLLYLEMDLVPWRQSINFFLRRRRREQQNLRRLRTVLSAFDPDLVFIWGMWNLHRSLAVVAEATYPDAVVYRFADYWPTLPSQHELYWRTPGRTWLSRLPKRLLRRVALALMEREDPPPALQFPHVVCVSTAVRDRLVAAGIPVGHARTIHTGIHVERYWHDRPQGEPERDDGVLQLLYAGRLSADKGVETAVRALGHLVHRHGRRDVRLSLAGSGTADYETHLRSVVTAERVSEYVSFLGHVPREDMPALLGRFDVLLVPSIWPEPFARIVLEGMAAGLVVVATRMGGTAEIVRDGETGLLFEAEESEALARHVVELADAPALRHRLARSGQNLVVSRFTTAKMLDAYETYLSELTQRASAMAVSS